MNKEIIYFDNAATSWPKPEATYAAADHYSRTVGGSPGRSGHRLSIEAGRIVLEAREKLAALFNIAHVFQIAFTKNATEALNIAICGLVSPGDHCITTSMEHNSVMRPLRALEKTGLELSVVPCSPKGELDPAEIKKAIRKNTRMVICSHASNVTGTIMPVEDISRTTRERGITFCVDAAQTAGAVPIDVEGMGIDVLAFTGHKSLLGLQGTGGLYIRKGIDIQIAPLMRGGTGSRSEFEEHPDFMPDRFEPGTPNTPGLAGLEAGVSFILNKGIDRIREEEKTLTRYFLDKLQRFPFVEVYGTKDPDRMVPVISFGIRGVSLSEASLFFDEEYGILSRPGLHCAPAAHRTIGTFPAGTNRFSFGCFNTTAQLDRACAAIENLAGRHCLR
jgi:cysteine desulfurase family protein